MEQASIRIVPVEGNFRVMRTAYKKTLRHLRSKLKRAKALGDKFEALRIHGIICRVRKERDPFLPKEHRQF